jgi:cbb3-type cytochrome oxidase subunit 3
MLESRQIRWPAYLVAFAMIVVPLADVFTTLYPWRFLEARWRFGAVGLVSNSLLIPTAGLLLAFLTAGFLNHRTMRRIIGAIGMFVAAICLVALLLFVLDAVQTRAGIRPDMRVSFNVASIAAAMKTLLAGVTFLAIGISALRRPKKTGELAESDVPILAVDSATAKALRRTGPA